MLVIRAAWRVIGRAGIGVDNVDVAAATQRGWNALNARFSYDLMDDRMQVALWARNLLDEANFSNVTPIISTFGVATRYYNPPRQFGGELSYRF